jgi:hypothetical protein
MGAVASTSCTLKPLRARACLQPAPKQPTPILRIGLGKQFVPLGWVNLPVTFGDTSN